MKVPNEAFAEIKFPFYRSSVAFTSPLHLCLSVAMVTTVHVSMVVILFIHFIQTVLSSAQESYGFN